MAYRNITFSLLCDWSGNNTFAFDETNYLSQANGDESMANPDESAFASSGFTTSANFTLLNKDRRFSPSASPAIASGGLLEYLQNGKFYGRKVQFSVTIDGTTYVVFRGYVKQITENARTVESFGTVTLRCSTEEASIIGQKINTPASTTKAYYETGKNEGELIANTLTLAGLTDGVNFISQAYGSGTPTLDQGLFTIPWYWLDGESPIDDCWKLAAACGGRFYFSAADGKYYYKNAQALYFDEAGTSQETISESNAKRINPVYSDKELVQSVKVTVQPRRIGESAVLWEPDEVIRILPGAATVLEAKLNTPVYSFDDLKIVATNTGGFQITGDLSVSSVYYSQAIKFTITNNGIYHAFLRTFQLIGRPLEGGQTTEVNVPSLDTTFWNTRDGKERAVSDNPYVQTLAQGDAITQLLAHRQGYYTPTYEVEGYKGSKFLRVRWRASLISTSMNISTEALITKMSWRLSENNFEQGLTLCGTDKLYQYTPGEYYKINVNAPNQSKRYHY